MTVLFQMEISSYESITEESIRQEEELLRSHSAMRVQAEENVFTKHDLEYQKLRYRGIYNETY